MSDFSMAQETASQGYEDILHNLQISDVGL
jgi:hypothetical protein